MSILDPSIILASGDISNPNKLLDLKLGMQKLQAGDQAMQKQNALKMLLSSPQSYANGQLTPQAKQATFAADPELGLEIQKQDMNAQVQKAKMAASATAAGAKKFDLYSKLAGVGVNAYEDAKKNGKSEEDARGAAVQARNTAAQEAYGSGSGLLSEQDYTGLTGHKFDPLGATALASLDKDWSTGREKAKSDDRADRRENRMENMEGARLGIEDKRLSIEERRIKDAEDKASDQSAKWEVLTDTKKDADGNPVQYRYNPATAKATTLTGDPYTPAGASKLGGNTQPRSGSALAVQKFIQENPNATAADVQKFVSRGAGQSSAFRSFMGGADGKQLQSLGVATDHLMTLRDLNEAFKGGDERTLARAKAAWETEFGTPAPSNIDTAAQFVAPELIKAIEGSSGGVQEREDLVKKFSSGRGQANVDGAIDTAFAYMGGQLQGMHQKLVKTEKILTDDEFNDAVPTVARNAMAKHATHSPNSLDEKGESSKSAAALPKVSDKASYSALKSGDRFLDPDGHERVKP